MSNISMALGVGSVLSLMAAGVLSVPLLLGFSWPVAIAGLVPLLCQVTALIQANQEPVEDVMGGGSWPGDLFRLLAASWCAASGLMLGLGTLSLAHFHGVTALVVPGSGDAAFEEFCCGPMTLLELGLATLLVLGQLSGAIVILIGHWPASAGPHDRPCTLG